MTYEQRARLEDAIERYANAKALEEVVTDFETKAMCSRHTQDAWGEVSRLLTRLEEIEAYNSAKSRVTSTLAMLDYPNELTVIALCGVSTW
jgi:hypothetical protein